MAAGGGDLWCCDGYAWDGVLYGGVGMGTGDEREQRRE